MYTCRKRWDMTIESSMVFTRLIVAFPPPWNTMTLLEAAVLRFPDVERIALRMIVAAIIIALRRGANDILFASLANSVSDVNYFTIIMRWGAPKRG